MAVEPSTLMAELGIKVEEAIREQHAPSSSSSSFSTSSFNSRTPSTSSSSSSPRVSWVRQLPSLDRSPHLKRKFDLVVCAFALGEEPGGEKGRQRLLRSLWGETNDLCECMCESEVTGWPSCFLFASLCLLLPPYQLLPPCPHHPFAHTSSTPFRHDWGPAGGH